VTEHAGRQQDAATKVEPAGDIGALRASRFARIIDRYQGSLLRYVRGMIGSRNDQSEDIVQECFLRLHCAWGEVPEPAIERVGPWLFTVVHNLTMDAIRKRRRHRTMQEKVNGGAEATDEFGVVGRVTRSEAAAAALSALDRLPDEQKEVVLMKVVEGLTFRQIAKVTGLSLGSVNYRLNQALDTLAGRLKRFGRL